MNGDVYKAALQAGSDLQNIFSAQAEKRRWRAEGENAQARVQLATINEGCATLLSGHDPVASLGMNRDHLRCVLSYIRHGDVSRMNRELALLAQPENNHATQ